jgi:hypothetical protein
MDGYGEPKTFKLDYGQMNQLFELLDEVLKDPKRSERVQRLQALRNQLYSHLS